MLFRSESLPKNYQPEYTQKLTGGNFDSEIRSNALMLNVLLEVDPNNRQIPMIITYLSKNSEKIQSTQESAFALLALGKAASKTNNSDMKVDVVVNGKTIATYNNKDLSLSNKELNSGNIVLKSKGKGEVYYFWNTEGIKSGSYIKEEDAYISSRRTYFDFRTKKEIISNQFEQGQLIVCKISLTGYDRSVDNLVITDMFPSGFEIENPHLSSTNDIVWKSSNPLEIDYTDVRDDRIILFTKINAKETKEYYYMLRVINKGVFHIPPLATEAMYAPEYHSYKGLGKATILASK